MGICEGVSVMWLRIFKARSLQHIRSINHAKNVIEYIEQQEVHHAKKTLKDEMDTFMKKYGWEYVKEIWMGICKRVRAMWLKPQNLTYIPSAKANGN